MVPPSDGTATPTEPTPPAPTPVEPARFPAPKEPLVVVPNGLPFKPAVRETGLRFGSYGRVVAGSDLRGGKPEKVLVVAHGPRVVESSYLELELSYGFEYQYGQDPADVVTLKPVFTLAFDGTLFHDTGEFDAHPAIRNMYLEARPTKSVALWAGSRMYRGDDLYLFDYWPLDDQNTVGGGAEYHTPADRTDAFSIAGHVGWNRLNNDFTFQQIQVADPAQGATTVTQLDRQRTVASATASFTHAVDADTHVRAKVHAEVHALPAGVRRREDGTHENLPSDAGFLVGAEGSIFGLAPKDAGFRRFANVFARYASGLAAFDELAPPTTFGPDLKTSNASELSFGLSAGWDTTFGNLMLGALSRRFVDADGDAVDHDDGWEYAVDVRPLVKLARGVFAGADLSYQARFPRGLSPITLIAQDATVFQIAPMVVYSPLGPSAYDRPQLRLVYRAAHLDQGALDLYVPDDPRHYQPWVHFLGVEAEWWFNSSTYR
ncbi:MAG: carbohydrate porin [Proteobacteria bacterium]|nr:carbohydrate porin [Pseudomonadota bacterium]